jgi:hypothetical protein
MKAISNAFTYLLSSKEWEATHFRSLLLCFLSNAQMLMIRFWKFQVENYKWSVDFIQYMDDWDDH